MGGGASWTRYAFRSHPFRRRQSVRAVIAPLTGRAAVEYSGQLRRENSERWLELRGQASTLNAVRFHGFGNQTEAAGDLSRVWLHEVIVAAGWHLPIGRGVELVPGAVVKYTDPSPRAGAPVTALPRLGDSPIGQLQATGTLLVDTRDIPWFPRRGFDVEITAFGAPPVWNIDSSYGKLQGSAATYLSVPFWNAPVVAIRAGGATLWGDFPFHEAAFLGGSGSLRGFQRERYAGEASLFGNAEIRLPLAEVELLVRGDLGVSGLVDAGRVYMDGASPGGWHHATGGSLWFSTPALSVSVTYANGDGHRLYADIGLPF